MTLVKIAKREVASMPYLFYLAKRYIYEKDTMTKQDIDFMMQSVVKWSKKLDLTDDENQHLVQIADMLKKEERGVYKMRIEFFKRNNIDWRNSPWS